MAKTAVKLARNQLTKEKADATRPTAWWDPAFNVIRIMYPDGRSELDGVYGVDYFKPTLFTWTFEELNRGAIGNEIFEFVGNL